MPKQRDLKQERDFKDLTQLLKSMEDIPEATTMDDTMDTTLYASQESLSELNYPYVTMTVEEVSVVQSLNNWLNPKIRVIGTFDEKPDDYVLRGVHGDSGEVRLDLDWIGLDQYPMRGVTVEAYAMLHEDRTQSEPQPVIKAKVLFFRKLRGDIPSYRRALALVKPFIPLFIKRRTVKHK